VLAGSDDADLHAALRCVDERFHRQRVGTK
jgi:hypothetical protein